MPGFECHAFTHSSNLSIPQEEAPETDKMLSRGLRAAHVSRRNETGAYDGGRAGGFERAMDESVQLGREGLARTVLPSNENWDARLGTRGGHTRQGHQCTWDLTNQAGPIRAGASRRHGLLAACCRGLHRRRVLQLRMADQLLVDLGGEGRSRGWEVGLKWACTASQMAMGGGLEWAPAQQASGNAALSKPPPPHHPSAASPRPRWGGRAR